MKQKILTNEQVGSVCMALSHLLGSGIGAGDALALLSADERDAQTRQMLETMAAGIDGGKSLSAVMKEAGRFPGYVWALAEVGERVGKAEETLEALSSYYENRARLEARLRSALLYPAVLLAVLLAVVTVLLVWVLPVFEQVYAQLGSGLTGIAAVLLAVGSALKQALPVLLAVFVIVVGLILIPAVRQTVTAFWKRHRRDRGVWGEIHRARFMQALSLGYSSGMTAADAVRLAASLCDEPSFWRCCQQCAGALEAGDSLPTALRSAGILRSAQSRLLEAGQRSGRAEQVLAHIARQLLEDSEEALQRRAEKAEPAVVVIACVLIGLVILSVMLPLVNIMSTIG